MSVRYPLFVKRDLDGFFGLAIDNLVQLLLIVTLCGVYCGMVGESAGLVYRYILPGAAVSLLIGNLFYAAQAHWVARRDGPEALSESAFGMHQLCHRTKIAQVGEMNSQTSPSCRTIRT